MDKEETLLEILRMADIILSESQEPAVRIRLFRDIFEFSDQELEVERELLENTEKVKLLAAKQDERGDFDRLGKHIIGPDRFVSACYIALNLGLANEHPILVKAREFAEWCLSMGILDAAAQMEAPDPGEGPRQNLAVFERNLAAVLGMMDKKSPLVEDVFRKWKTIVSAAFASGDYDPNAKDEAYRSIYGEEHTPWRSKPERKIGDHEVVCSASLLSTGVDALKPEIDLAYTKWFVRSHRSWAVHTHDNIMAGINQLIQASVPMRYKASIVSGVLFDMDNLYGFRGWHICMEKIADILWKCRRDDGLWSFGASASSPWYITRIRLSDNWRGKRAAHDWTTRILLLLHKYYKDQ